MMRLLRHLVAWVRRGRLDDEMRDELAQHVEWKAAQLVADGLSPDEARRQAALAVGNVLRLRETSRAVWGFPSLDTIAQDVRYGVRLLRKAPAFAGVSIASLAIGVGASAAVFSLADAVLFRPMAVRDPHSLVLFKWTSGPVSPFSSLNGSGEQTDAGLASTSFSKAAFDSFRTEAARDLDVLGFADLYQVTVSIDGRADVGTAHAVSGNYFDVLGVAPTAGRPLSAIDDRPDAAPAVVISDRLWKRRLGGDAQAVGKTVVINAVAFTVVGVLPPAFHGTGQVGTDPDLYVPLQMHARVMPDDDPPADPNYWWVLMIGRLKPGVTTEATRDALDVLLKRTVATAKPALAAKDLPRLALLPGGLGQVEDRTAMRDPLKTMGLVTLVVLLVACANVASLLLARGQARVRELSIRVAIGAPRGRVIRQLLTEAVLVAVAGGALGVAFAGWLSAALAPALSSAAEPADILTRIDGRVLAFAVFAAGVSAVVFGVVPAFRATDMNVGAGLQEAGRSAVQGPRRRRLSSVLVVAQIALSLLLVAAAGLLVRSVRNLEQVDLGFDASQTVLFRIDPAAGGYNGARTADLCSRLLDRLRAMPGVTAASMSSHRLISNSSAVVLASRSEETRPAPGSEDARAFQRTHLAWQLIVDEQFFSTFRIPFARGRGFNASDTGDAPIAIVNRALAQQLFGTDDAVGRFVALGSSRQPHAPIQIVGVVENAAYTSVREPRPPTAYLYYRQHPEMKSAPTFEIRSAGPLPAVAAAVREIVREIDANLPVDGITTQRDQIATSLRQERLFARLASVLGLVAVLLSAIGLYGLLAYGVARRVPEIGLRMALGAPRGLMQWMVLRESLVLAALGLAAGVPLALAGTGVLAAMLFGLAPRDPLTLAAAAFAMLALAAIAGYLPARRASRVDPLVALRAD